MARVRLLVGGRYHDLACRDGDEDRLRALAAILDVHVAEATRAVGPGSEARGLLLAGLLLADQLADATRAAEQAERVAARLEALADALGGSDPVAPAAPTP